MYKNEREQEIINFLNNFSYVTVEFLAKKLNISPSSIRRDLSAMEQRGIVKRSYGGVEIVKDGVRNVPFSMRKHENASAKKRIAEAAVSLLHEGDVVFIDGSSSAFFVAKELVKIRDITVITNSIESLCFFMDYDIRAYCTGGNMHRENRATLVNDHAENMISNFYADYTFFSAQALTRQGKIYDCYSSEVPLRNKMMQNSAKSVFLCDSTKLGRHSAYYQCNVNTVDYVISDVELLDYFDQCPENTLLLKA
ncbi:MAG: DeoR/GlpR transcriptional regulator [Ruminococcaceae bacterium]|nr:DeoR/GlpR transcriptional regulator [Oscillospiraceae bacterium]